MLGSGGRDRITCIQSSPWKIITEVARVPKFVSTARLTSLESRSRFRDALNRILTNCKGGWTGKTQENVRERSLVDDGQLFFHR